MAHHSGLLAIGTSSHPYIHFQSLTKAKPILSDFKLSSPISALALTSRFCLASTSSTIQIYDFLTSTTLQPIHLSESDNIKHLSFISPTTIFIACTSGTWYTYSLTTRSILTTTTSIRGLASACTTPVIGGHRILAGYKDGNVRSWILNLTPTLLIIPLPILCSISDQVTSLTVFGNILVAGSWDGKIRIWDLKSNQRRTLTSRDKSPVMSLTVADGVLVSGHYNGSITSISFKRA